MRRYGRGGADESGVRKCVYFDFSSMELYLRSLFFERLETGIVVGFCKYMGRIKSPAHDFHLPVLLFVKYHYLSWALSRQKNRPTVPPLFPGSAHHGVAGTAGVPEPFPCHHLFGNGKGAAVALPPPPPEFGHRNTPRSLHSRAFRHDLSRSGATKKETVGSLNCTVLGLAPRVEQAGEDTHRGHSLTSFGFLITMVSSGRGTTFWLPDFEPWSV